MLDQVNQRDPIPSQVALGRDSCKESSSLQTPQEGVFRASSRTSLPEGDPIGSIILTKTLKPEKAHARNRVCSPPPFPMSLRCGLTSPTTQNTRPSPCELNFAKDPLRIFGNDDSDVPIYVFNTAVRSLT